MGEQSKVYTVSGTGHRPPDYQTGYSYNTVESETILNETCNALESILFNQFPNFKILEYGNEKSGNVFRVINGGALGFDEILLMATIVLRDKFKYYDIKIECITAATHHGWFSNRTLKVIESAKVLYNSVDDIICVDTLPEYRTVDVPVGVYHKSKFYNRNNYMLDNSDFILALYGGKETGGTAHAFRSALKRDLPILNLWDKCNLTYKK